ncbi:cyclic nucleotide-binding domain-containing protein [uncultured Nocardioides sp.]|uniref:Crp/Fnr family transcriptional regulator n=1 Tax=uncultured Nocardioides sp. TaxID=198441 RepID=UPI0026BF1FC0|tara:strand:- start:2515 stop:2925 length:411 start_codon:yes stop_codon:yes gene_type:complete
MARTTEYLLRSVPALADCSPRELRRMAALMDVVSLRSGATLTSEGEFENQAFLLVEGQVAVTVGEDLVTVLGPGELVGELGVIDRRLPRTATVTAMTPVTACVLTPRGFDSLRRGFPAVAALVDRTVAARQERLAG